jgi:hypothetical protein
VCKREWCFTRHARTCQQVFLIEILEEKEKKRKEQGFFVGKTFGLYRTVGLGLVGTTNFKI